MDLDYAFLADAAEVSSDGKLYALGAGVNVIRATKFPVMHPHLSLVIRLRLHPTECNREHRLDVELWDPDGKSLARLDGKFGAAQPEAHGTRPAFVQMVFNYVNTEFLRPGDFAFHVLVNGQHFKELPVFVEEVPLPSVGKN